MFKRVRLVAAAFVLPWLIIGVLGLMGARTVDAAPAAQTATTWTAYMGHEIFTEKGEKPTWEADRFYPAQITINAGDTVVWKHNSSAEPHTVTFLGTGKFPDFTLPPAGGPPPKIELNPLVFLPQGAKSYDGSAYTNSGVMAADIPGPKEYGLTFTKPGTYTYYCSIHAVPMPDGSVVGMQATIVVQAAGSTLPKTAAQVEADARAEMAADDAEATQQEATVKKAGVPSTKNADGSTTYQVGVGNMIFKPTYDLDYMRFLPKDLTVKVGDTVEWVATSPHAFHNVTFGQEPDIFTIEPQPQGPPKAFVNLEVFGPVGANPGTHTGGGVYSSGIIVGPEDPPQQGVQKYALTFTQPGRYEYVCALHYNLGMDAQIVVQSAGGTSGGTGPGTAGEPGMPRTGGGADSALLVLAALAAIGALASGLVLRLRKAHVED